MFRKASTSRVNEHWLIQHIRGDQRFVRTFRCLCRCARLYSILVSRERYMNHHEPLSICPHEIGLVGECVLYDFGSPVFSCRLSALSECPQCTRLSVPAAGVGHPERSRPENKADPFPIPSIFLSLIAPRSTHDSARAAFRRTFVNKTVLGYWGMPHR